jgi:putative membrane protein insertion efficiency factor
MSVASRVLQGAIKVYQVAISPVLGQRCRFHPSCSCYAADAVERHGALQGIRLAFSRFIRCHPWSDGGLDPVPDEVRSAPSPLAKTSR